ncbi:interleukin-1 beta [Gadus chalcogrammus]|uniref:interleukin-1 beta n=1 Tax=Gadus chalcogrammus TaxID=1042646 RepID=UPI0024C40C46|nr:interleukin-1 beta [Gadus chalcogrammus]
MAFQCEYSSMKQTTSSEHWSDRMPQGMDLEITNHPLTMKQVVHLVIAIDRLKGSQSEQVQSSEFRDEDLLNLLLENALDEQLVLELTEAAPPRGFTANEPSEQCALRDQQKRSLVLVKEAMELHAIRLQGGTTDHEVTLNMTTYLDPRPSAPAQPAVALGIRGTKLYLSCTQTADRPTLNLEEVENTDDLKSISKDSDMVRFLFYRTEVGVSATSLVSARYSGWYISTATEDNLPVEVCLQSESRYRSFTILQG